MKYLQLLILSLVFITVFENNLNAKKPFAYCYSSIVELTDPIILKKAKEQIKRGNHDKALEILSKTKKTDFDAMLLKIEIYSKKRDYSAARNIAEGLLMTSFIPNLKYHELMATVYYRSGKDFDNDAKLSINQAIETSPNKIELRKEALKIADRSNDKKAKIEHYTFLAKDYETKKDYKNAIETYNNLKALEKDNLTHSDKTADIYLLLGKKEKAVSIWWELSDYFFHKKKNHTNKDLESTLEYINKIDAISLTDTTMIADNRKAIIRIGEIEAGRDKYTAAINSYERLPEEDPDRIYGICRTRLRQGENSKLVKKDLKKFLSKKNRRNNDLSGIICKMEMLLGMAYFQDDKFQKGVRKMKKVMKKCPDVANEVNENPNFKKYYMLNEGNRKTIWELLTRK